jgi:hypothetical protein
MILRSEEACGLRWSEIDLAGGCLRLAQTKTGDAPDWRRCASFIGLIAAA